MTNKHDERVIVMTLEERHHQQLQKKDQLIRDLKCDVSDIGSSHKKLVELIKKERAEKAQQLQKAREEGRQSVLDELAEEQKKLTQGFAYKAPYESQNGGTGTKQTED